MKIKFSCGVLHVGNNLDILPTLPDNSVHCCVTSPPYWNLRDYGTGSWVGGDPKCDHLKQKEGMSKKNTLHKNGEAFPEHYATNKRGIMQFSKKCEKCGANRVDRQLGQEDTPEEFVVNMVKVFREVRRVLRNDGTLWLNIGDSYNSKPPGNKRPMSKSGLNGSQTSKKYRERLEGTQQSQQANRKLLPGLKAGDLVGIPWMLAFALRADGWWLRQDIIWAKRDPMPESVKNRCTKSHEYLFLLTKQRQYFYDRVAIMEAATPASIERMSKPMKHPRGWHTANVPISGGTKYDGIAWPSEIANKRSVWTTSCPGVKDAHFAVFPEALIRPCVLAGTSEKGCCAKCGAPIERIVKKNRAPTRTGADTKVTGTNQATHGNRDPQRHVTSVMTLGWKRTCECKTKETTPCVVLDPFMGSGTTARVAVSKMRNFVGIELNPVYAELARKRINKAIMNRGFGL